MNREPPARKQTDPAKLPGQVAYDIETMTAHTTAGPPNYRRYAASLFGVSPVDVTEDQIARVKRALYGPLT